MPDGGRRPTDPPAFAGAALARLAGFAPSPVLDGRLRRAAALCEACADVPPDADHPAWAALLDAVTVQETRLFRHPGQFAALPLPDLAARAHGEARPLRLLSAGCATGEEAFSLAALARAEGAFPAEVLGLDLCRPALDSARTGRVTDGLGDSLAWVPPACRAWFAGGQADPVIMAACRFRRANLLDLPPDLGAFDVVFCRNVLIYLVEEARAAVLRRLLALLRPGGVLALGPTDRGPDNGEALGEALWRKAD
ncbi:MAG: methyltransferase domain-containing protein [Acetobacteraceae bacterium]|nr:methyltransferase domain-containing protein [Acetobacteraceae bacterium]